MMFGGLSGIGKTTLMLHLMKDLAEGKPLWGLPGFPVDRPARSLLVDNESGPELLVQRVKQIWAEAPDPKMLHADVMNIGQLGLDSEEGQSALREQVMDLGIDVVLIDPITYCFTGSIESNEEVKSVYRRFVSWMRWRKDLSIVYCHHFRKPAQEDYDPHDPYNFRGASTWVNISHCVITCRQAKRDRREIAIPKIRTAAGFDGRILLDFDENQRIRGSKITGNKSVLPVA